MNVLLKECVSPIRESNPHWNQTSKLVSQALEQRFSPKQFKNSYSQVAVLGIVLVFDGNDGLH